MSGLPGKVGEPPAHYAGKGMQPFDVIDAYRLDFYSGNALKYLLRWDKKDDSLSNLRKALHYIEETIIRWESDEQRRWGPGVMIPKQMHPEAVYRAFDLSGNAAEAVFYLLYWRIGAEPTKDITRAKRYVRLAIQDEEAAFDDFHNGR